MAISRISDATEGLDRTFARRMAPLTVLVALTMAVAPPLMILWADGLALEDEARQNAGRIAEAVEGVATRQPWLWRYNIAKVIQATSGYRSLTTLGQVQVTDCTGGVLFSADALQLGTGNLSGPSGWAPVKDRGRVVAWVHVTMDPEPGRQRAAIVGLLSITLGTVIGALLFWWPVSVVRRQARELRALVARLRDAEEGLKRSNADLAARVNAAVGEVRSLSERVLSIQEDERSRVARELHDGLGQLIAALDIELQLAERSNTPQPHLHEARNLCETTLHELRRAVRDLQPLELETSDLSDVLREMCERFEIRTGIVTSFRHVGGPITDPQVARCLLRVAQEALNNVRKHARATEVGVALTVAAATRLDVRDDGEGFTPEEAPPGMGLRSIHERVHYLGGSSHVRSAPGEGTHVGVELPRREDDAPGGQGAQPG